MTTDVYILHFVRMLATTVAKQVNTERRVMPNVMYTHMTRNMQNTTLYTPIFMPSNNTLSAGL